MIDILSELAIIVSLSLTVPYLCYCVEIQKLWHPSMSRGDKPSRQLARGIFYGFTASGLDNVFWAMAWAFFLFNKEVGMFLIALGSLPNIFFRQLGGIYAAREHVFAAYMIHEDRMPKYSKYYWIACAVCFVMLTYLVFF